MLHDAIAKQIPQRQWCFSLNDKGMEVGRQMGMKP